jgi:DnaJ-class molecular chaperone
MYLLSFCILHSQNNCLLITAYRVLGINKDASSSEIKKSYHKLALKHHPDKQNTDEDRARAQSLFAKIAGAYEILSDDDKRQEYDTLQAEQKNSSGRSRGYDSNKFHVDFNDPYEVFKRAFQQQWGMEYPGSKYDYSEEPIPQNQQRLTNGDEKNQKKLLTNGKESNYSSKDKKSKTSKKDNPNDKSKSTPARSNSSSRSNDPNPGNGVLVVSDRHNPANQQLVAARDPHDNRPTSINTTTKEIKHKDGTVETVTETTITRPDGSTETIQMTDKGDKRKDWKKPNAHNLLTNGEDSNPRRQITDGKNNNKSKPFFRLTNHAHNDSTSSTTSKSPNHNGSSRSSISGLTTSKKKAAAPEAPRPKRTGIFGRK